jgi:hypothetical protein
MCSPARTAWVTRAPKRLHRLRANFFVPGARTIVCDFVHACTTYQRNKADHLHPVGLLRPREVPSAVWADIVMYFIEGFPKVSGKSVILTVVDRLRAFHTPQPPLHGNYGGTCFLCRRCSPTRPTELNC